ncbi:glycosyltransferase family 39 protein [Paenibacillus sp. sgz500958]|uniref:glycosyltransferase family 39 protein n=1 Tax=Paenibacillus sp. sgz500958 TaxID=3242475 RepID=UPI0036D3E0F5
MGKLFQKTIYFMLAGFIGLFVASSFVYRAQYNYFVYGDTPVLERQKLGIFLLVIVLVVLLSIAMYRLCLKLNKYSWKTVIPLVLLCSFGIQLVIIFLFTRVPTDDSQTVLSLAMSMLYDKDYSSFQTEGYLHMFPFNFSIVLYLKTLLLLFPDNYLVIKIFNILFSLVTTLMVYLIYKELNYKSKDNDYGVLVFAATYIPSLFMSNLIYNDIIATAFLTTALYLVIRFIKGKELNMLIGAAIALAIGNYFRSVGVIVLIAAAISILLNLKRIGIQKSIVALGIMAVLFNVPNWTQNAALQAAGIVDESVTANSAPVYMWLNMGINTDTFGFWDNRESYSIYQNDAGYDKAASTELFKEEISRKLSEAPPGELAKMYYKKIVWTWTEGTYQMDRYGISNEGGGGGGQRMGALMGGYSYSTFATDLFAGDSAYRSALLWMVYVLNFLMYGMILVRLIGGIRAKRFDEVSLILVILGFIGFYILWEIKSRYIYPVYPLLIVLSYMGFKDVHDYMLTSILPRYRASHGKEL